MTKTRLLIAAVTGFTFLTIFRLCNLKLLHSLRFRYGRNGGMERLRPSGFCLRKTLLGFTHLVARLLSSSAVALAFELRTSPVRPVRLLIAAVTGFTFSRLACSRLV